ncbi:MAG: sulfotransferase [Phycisphaerales bacterium]
MELLKRFKPAKIEAPAPESRVDHSLFFVRGHPRSGTNWIGALLNLHPQVNCFGEFHFEDIRNAIDAQQSQPWQITAREPLKTVMDQWFREMVRRAMLTLENRKPGAHWIGDRTPRGLRVFVEHAPHFLILRDGRDVLVSWTFHILRMRPHVLDVVVPPDLRRGFNRLYERFQADNAHFARHPEELLSDEGWVRMVAGRWAGWVRADQGAVRRIEANDEGARARLQVIRYEALHADVEGGRRTMYEFLGLDPAEAAPISAETRTEPGFQKDDPTSFWRHGRVGDWRRYSTDPFKRWFKESAGEALTELGYENDNNW